MSAADPPLTFWRSGRWIPIVVFVIVMAVACVLLARWQFHRLDDKRAANTQVSQNESLPVESLTTASTAIANGDDAEWRRVEATGEYDTTRELLARKRAYEGRVGYFVVTPLRTVDGTVWAARGWIPAGPDARTASAVPAAPDGTVTITGYVRAWEPAGSEAGLPDGQIHRITAETVAEATSPYPFWIQVEDEQPAGETIQRIEAPELGEGPHLSYALQWSAFAIMALIGGIVLVRRQREYFAEDLAAARDAAAHNETTG